MRKTFRGGCGCSSPRRLHKKTKSVKKKSSTSVLLRGFPIPLLQPYFPAMPDDDCSSRDLLDLLIENRAAIDVIFEMMAYNCSEGEEDEYRYYLNSMQKRYQNAIETYRETLEDDASISFTESEPPKPEPPSSSPDAPDSPPNADAVSSMFEFADREV